MSAARIGSIGPRRATERLFDSWDKGSQAARCRILRDFIDVQQGKTVAELEDEFSLASCLLLSRISAALQLNLHSRQPIYLLLRAANVFLAAAGGTDYVSEFSKMGGNGALLEATKSPNTTDKEKLASLLCLKSVVYAGADFQAALCRNHAVSSLGECLGLSRDVDTQEAAKELLESLPARNEDYLEQVYSTFVKTLSAPSFQARYLAVMALPALQRRMPKPPDSLIVNPLVDLLECGDLQVQHEVYQLMRLLLDYKEIQLQLVQALLRALRPPESTDLTTVLVPDAKGMESEEVTFEPALPIFIRQAACAGFVRLIAEEHDPSNEHHAAVLHAIGKEHAAEYLLHAMGNLSYANSRKHAAQALQALLKLGCRSVRDALSEAVGDDFPYTIQDAVDIDDISLNVTPLQSETMRSALLRLDHAGKAL